MDLIYHKLIINNKIKKFAIILLANDIINYY